MACSLFFFFQAEDGIRDVAVTGVQTCALPISNVGCAGGFVYDARRAIGYRPFAYGPARDRLRIRGDARRILADRIGRDRLRAPAVAWPRRDWRRRPRGNVHE